MSKIHRQEPIIIEVTYVKQEHVLLNAVFLKSLGQLYLGPQEVGNWAGLESLLFSMWFLYSLCFFLVFLLVFLTICTALFYFSV